MMLLQTVNEDIKRMEEQSRKELNKAENVCKEVEKKMNKCENEKGE